MKDGKTEVQTSCSTCCKPCAPFQTPKLRDVNAMQSTGSCLKLCLLKCVHCYVYLPNTIQTQTKKNPTSNTTKKKEIQAGRQSSDTHNTHTIHNTTTHWQWHREQHRGYGCYSGRGKDVTACCLKGGSLEKNKKLLWLGRGNQFRAVILKQRMCVQQNWKRHRHWQNRFLVRPDGLLIYRDIFYLEYLCKKSPYIQGQFSVSHFFWFPSTACIR